VKAIQSATEIASVSTVKDDALVGPQKPGPVSAQQSSTDVKNNGLSPAGTDLLPAEPAQEGQISGAGIDGTAPGRGQEARGNGDVGSQLDWNWRFNFSSALEGSNLSATQTPLDSTSAENLSVPTHPSKDANQSQLPPGSADNEIPVASLLPGTANSNESSNPPAVKSPPANQPPAGRAPGGRGHPRLAAVAEPAIQTSVEVVQASAESFQASVESGGSAQASQSSGESSGGSAGSTVDLAPSPAGGESNASSDKPLPAPLQATQSIPQMLVNLDDLVRSRLGLPSSGFLNRSGVETDLDSYFLDVWDDDQMRFPDASPAIDETLFPNGIPNIDEMPFPDPMPAPGEATPLPGGASYGISMSSPAPDMGLDFLSMAQPLVTGLINAAVGPAAQRDADGDLIESSSEKLKPHDPLRVYKLVMCLLPCFFAFGISAEGLREKTNIIRGRLPRLRK
jgi:hypothetical protein